MKKNKTRLMLMATLTLTLFAGTVAYGYMAVLRNEINLGSLLALSIPLIVIVFMIFFILRRYKDVRRGMPLEDERSKKVITKAAAQSFYVSLYWLLAISWFESFFADKLFGGQHLDASQTVGGGIAGMAVFFFISWWYYNKQDKLV